MVERVKALSVFDGDRLIGAIHDTTPMSFEYASAWLLDPDGYDIVATVPRQAGRISAPAVEALFENLLPEGILRDMLSREAQTSSTFGLLLKVAGDTAGGFTIVPEGEQPDGISYTQVDWTYVANHFAGGLQSRSAAQPLGSRISLSGAQAKMLIGIDLLSGDPMLPQGTTPSTWIVKPNIRGFEQVWSSAANEAILMRTASHCDIGVAEVFLEPTTQACIVRRFDRVPGANGGFLKLRQYDFCQLMGIASGVKYEADGGPGFKACADIIRKHSVRPAVDMKRFLEWVFFNLYTGNNDGHAKNLSLYHVPGEGLRLTPFYDLMDTRLYPGLARNFAFRIGGQTEPGKITKDDLVAMADEVGLKASYVIGTAASMYAKLQPALERAIKEIEPSLDHSGIALADKLQNHVLSIAKKNSARFTGGEQVDLEEDLPDEEPPRARESGG
jgi:serine/threonine-protein kinase HipA